MSSEKFLTKEQEKRVVEAIGRAEHQTSGEIRVHIERYCQGDPLKKAPGVFHDLGMGHTEHQNGVLLYIATEDKKAAVYAGSGIHEQVEKDFWKDVLKLLLDHFKNESFEEGIVQAVEKVGIKLKDLFPYRRDDVNELPDEISYNEDNEI